MKTSLLILTTLCCFFISSEIFAQPLASWLVGSSGTASNPSLIPGSGGMKADSLGNTYIFGEVYQGTVKYGSLSADDSVSDNNWLYIVKLDPSGNALWIKGITGNNNLQARTIAVNQNGYFSVGGDYSGTVTFDSIHSITSKSYDNFFVAGYDSAGNFLWVNSPDSSGPTLLNGLFVSKNNATFCTGNFDSNIVLDSVNYPSIEGTSIFLTKINKAGTVEWLRQGTTSNGALAYSEKVTVENGIVYIAGFFEDSVAFGSNVLYGNNSQQMFLAKYDTAGNMQWAKGLGTGSTIVTALGADAYNVNIGGTVDQNGAIFGNDTVPGVGDATGAFVLGCDSSGAIRWVNSIFSSNGSSVYDLATGKDDGNVFVVGASSGSLLTVNNFTPLIDSITTINQGFGFLLKFDSLGQIQWGQPFAGGGYDDAEQLSLQTYELTVAGTYSDTLSVDNFTINAGFSTQVYVCRFALTPNTGITELPRPMDWKIFPVPSNNIVTIQTGANVLSQLQVTDLTGQVVAKQIFNGNQTTLDLSGYAPGVYMVTMQNKDGSSNSKMVIKE